MKTHQSSFVAKEKSNLHCCRANVLGLNQLLGEIPTQYSNNTCGNSNEATSDTQIIYHFSKGDYHEFVSCPLLGVYSVMTFKLNIYTHMATYLRSSPSTEMTGMIYWSPRRQHSFPGFLSASRATSARGSSGNVHLTSSAWNKGVILVCRSPALLEYQPGGWVWFRIRGACSTGKKMKLAICLFLLFTARLFYLLFTLKIMRSFLGPVSESI